MPDYKLATTRAARKFGVDPAILRALVQQESGFNPNAKSPAGAQGIAQFMPGTAPAYGVNLHDNRVTDDLEGAAKYLKANLARTGGSYAKALSIYNSGRPDAYKDPKFAGGQTYNYVKTILGNAGKDTGASAPTSSGGSSGSTSGQTKTTTTTPGVDRSPQRAALISSFLTEKGADPLSFAMGIRGLQDTPGKTVTTRTAAGGQARPSAASGPAGSGRYPTGRTGKIIGTPYTGTHTLGNWQSDNAVDIAVPIGTPMVALQDGVVLKVTRHPQGAGRFAGDQITMRGANGNEYFYAHGVAAVKAGQRVRKGQSLGTTGSANGVQHLHFGQMKGDPRQHT